MPPFGRALLHALLCLGPMAASAADLPAALAVQDAQAVLTVHAEGLQIYLCAVDRNATEANRIGKLTWQFREPLAVLIQGSDIVGRHFAGPTWELLDGSRIQGKAVAHTPGATERDIPWLKLDVTASSGSGKLTGVTNVQRVNTSGGQLDGPCPVPGIHAEPYSADYIFLRK